MPSGLRIADEAVVLGAAAADWRAAVRLAGDALVAVGAATPDYTTAMLRMIEQHGPYVVIAPGLALAHARPGPEVLDDALAVVTLDAPVTFGHPYNDPVRVVLGLSVRTPDRHVQTVAGLATAFDDPGATAALAAATTADEVRRILGAETPA